MEFINKPIIEPINQKDYQKRVKKDGKQIS